MKSKGYDQQNSEYKLYKTTQFFQYKSCNKITVGKVIKKLRET